MLRIAYWVRACPQFPSAASRATSPRNTQYAIRATLLAAGLALVVRAGAQTAPVALVQGELPLAGVSGATAIRGGRLLLVSEAENGIVQLQDAARRLRGGSPTRESVEPLAPPLGPEIRVADLEDVAWDGSAYAYLVTSHSRVPEGEAPDERYRMVRLHFDATGKLLGARQSDGLLQGVVNGIPFLADSVRRTAARAGLNVEGLAWDPAGGLLVGLRAPTVTESRPRPHGGQEDAVVAPIANPEGLFAEPARPAEFGDVVKLDLRGQGIRGMAYDSSRRAWWLVSGLSAEPTHPVKSPWGLWLWNRKGEPRPARLPEGLRLEQPEAVAVLEMDGKPSLLLIDPGRPASRYALFPADATGL